MIINGIVDRLFELKDNYLHGFSDMTGLLGKVYTGYDFAIVIGRRMESDIIDGIKQGPTREYFDLYHHANKELLDTQMALSEVLTKNGFDHLLIKPTVSDSEIDGSYDATLTYPFSHKMAATRAGLGWIGKTDLMITEKFGPRVRFCTILTKTPLGITRKPYVESKCGRCSICVDSCPAGAATGGLWNISVHRDEFFNAFKCKEKCRELSMKNIGEEISICGICVSVCPRGK